MTTDPAAHEVRAETRGRLGLITLARPKALNALSLGMVERLDAILAAWASDPAVDAVAVRGEGTAFCAGGDVRALGRLADLGERIAAARAFFAREYRLNYRIHVFPKPYIALLDGVTMGGGCGISMHGSHRVATERSLIAMPETALGLFPDVGATWYLNQCPGRAGLYLGLVGRRLRATDALALGMATHHLPGAALDSLLAALAAEPRLDHDKIDRLLSGHATNPGLAEVAAQLSEIDRLFAGDGIEAILADLGAAAAPWARQAEAAIRAASPTSLKVTFRQLREGRARSLPEMFMIEYRLALRLSTAHDFTEGVRAILVDKDNAPKWSPARLEQVDEAALDAIFAPLDDPREELRVAEGGGA